MAVPVTNETQGIAFISQHVREKYNVDDILDSRLPDLLDRDDPLSMLRSEFRYPRACELPESGESVGSGECIYLGGNSLGLQPKRARAYIEAVMGNWARMGLQAQFHGTENAVSGSVCDQPCVASMARLVGAKASEVAIMNGLTVNLHILLLSFYRPTQQRYKIIIEAKAFPSDHYVVESQLRLNGHEPSDGLILIHPREGEECLREEDILQLLEEHASSTAVLLLSGVQYYTGQYFDIEKLTAEAQKRGIVAGWDLAHAAGNVPVQLHDWNVDFAAWCSYKYINSSIGGIAAAFVHERHHVTVEPRLIGWWGHEPSTRFHMTNEIDFAPGASAYAISNPPALLCAALRGSLDVFDLTSMEELRSKSLLLTSYLEALIDRCFGDDSDSKVKCAPLTPRCVAQRGAQLSLRFSVDVHTAYDRLTRSGVVCDKRYPSVIRVAPAPLYNSFTDVHRFVALLRECFSD